MPMDRKRYPANWPEISLRIRARAGNRCEWCGAPNGAFIARLRENPHLYEIALEDDGACADFHKAVRVVLTVAHLGAPHADGRPGDKHDKMDCRDENLAALCQRCHLRYDLQEHAENARETRRAKRLEREPVFAGMESFA